MVGSSIGPGGGIARSGPIAGPAAVKDRRPPAGGEGAAPSSLTARRPRYNEKSQAIPPQPPLSSSSPRRPRPPPRETGRTGGMPALPEGVRGPTEAPTPPCSPRDRRRPSSDRERGPR